MDMPISVVDQDKRPERCRVRIPHWMGGHDVLGFAHRAGLDLTPVDVEAGLWDVCTVEAKHSASADLLRVEQIAGGSVPADRLAGALGTLPGEVPLTPGVERMGPERVQTELDRVLGSRPDDLVALTYSISLATLASSASAIADTVNQGLSALKTSGDDGSLFPSSEVFLIRNAEALALRYAFVRVLVRLIDEPEMFENKPGDGEVGRAFASGQGFIGDAQLGLSAYLDPLMLALSPWVWGFDAPRRGGVVVYSFGQAVAGRRGEPAELLQQHLPKGATRSQPFPANVTPETITAAMAWWVERLDRLFAAISNPANFVDADGAHNPRRQFEVILGVEQLFRLVGSLLAHERDATARRLLLFSCLDTIEGLGCGKFDTKVELRRSTKTLAAVESAVGSAAAPLLLPNARRGVEGLREVQEGFFLPSRVSDAGVRIWQGTSDTIVSRERAAAIWLRILRNAAHGFRGEADAQRQRDEALLLAHDGNVPEDLPLIAYLELLQLLAAPHQIDNILRRANEVR